MLSFPKKIIFLADKGFDTPPPPHLYLNVKFFWLLPLVIISIEFKSHLELRTKLMHNWRVFNVLFKVVIGEWPDETTKVLSKGTNTFCFDFVFTTRKS